MPGYTGVEIWQWNSHSVSETVVAVLACVAMAAFVTSRT